MVDIALVIVLPNTPQHSHILCEAPLYSVKEGDHIKYAISEGKLNDGMVVKVLNIYSYNKETYDFMVSFLDAEEFPKIRALVDFSHFKYESETPVEE